MHAADCGAGMAAERADDGLEIGLAAFDDETGPIS